MKVTQKEFSPQTPVYLKGQSTGYTMGLLEDKILTCLNSWEKDDKGALKQNVSEDYRVIPINGLHTSGLRLSAQVEDSGSAFMTKTSAFVALFLAGSDYTGTRYITCVAELFADIKRVTSTMKVEFLRDAPEEGEEE